MERYYICVTEDELDALGCSVCAVRSDWCSGTDCSEGKKRWLKSHEISNGKGWDKVMKQFISNIEREVTHDENSNR